MHFELESSMFTSHFFAKCVKTACSKSIKSKVEKTFLLRSKSKSGGKIARISTYRETSSFYSFSYLLAPYTSFPPIYICKSPHFKMWAFTLEERKGLRPHWQNKISFADATSYEAKGRPTATGSCCSSRLDNFTKEKVHILRRGLFIWWSVRDSNP